MKRHHFEQFAKGLELTDKQINGVFKRFVKSKPKAIKWIEKSFLSDDMKIAYKEVIENRYKQIKLEPI